jgi:hypothetical protein
MEAAPDDRLRRMGKMRKGLHNVDNNDIMAPMKEGSDDSNF